MESCSHEDCIIMFWKKNPHESLGRLFLILKNHNQNQIIKSKCSLVLEINITNSRASRLLLSIIIKLDSEAA